MRQIWALERRAPALRKPLHFLLRDRWFIVRLPIALMLVLGGLLSILPFLGLWMLPLGLLLLAVDVPILRPAVSSSVIRMRRWLAQRFRRKHR
ncbi:tryptophan synthase subunit beta [Histidinibacterium aquaticum]|uniref:tryptophan synthase subunit beta n=1 Tax=Histidinibacterium aquaticum TaxID=2613962 RepID=UPI001CC74D5C|nr:tryptophan synthase subunit beta [Histidinibacterium aquaticum]